MDALLRTGSITRSDHGRTAAIRRNTMGRMLDVDTYYRVMESRDVRGTWVGGGLAVSAVREGGTRVREDGTRVREGGTRRVVLAAEMMGS